MNNVSIVIIYDVQIHLSKLYIVIFFSDLVSWI